jgi:hypothetical protein
MGDARRVVRANLGQTGLINGTVHIREAGRIAKTNLVRTVVTGLAIRITGARGVSAAVVEITLLRDRAIQVPVTG